MIIFLGRPTQSTNQTPTQTKLVKILTIFEDTILFSNLIHVSE